MSEFIRETGSTPAPQETPRETGVAAADEAPEAVGVEGEVAHDQAQAPDSEEREPSPQELAEEDPSYEVRGDGSIAHFGSAADEDEDEEQEREKAKQSYSRRERGTSTGRK